MCSYALTVDSLWILQSHVLSFLFSPGFWLLVFSLIDAPPVCISSKITSSLKTLLIQIPVLLFRRLYHLLVSDVLSSACMCLGTDCTLFVFVICTPILHYYSRPTLSYHAIKCYLVRLVSKLCPDRMHLDL